MKASTLLATFVGAAIAAGGAGRASIKASCALTRQVAAKKIANAARGNIELGEINSHATLLGKLRV